MLCGVQYRSQTLPNPTYPKARVGYFMITLLLEIGIGNGNKGETLITLYFL